MQLGFEFVPTSVVTADDQFLEKAFLERSAQVLRDAFEMMQSFVVDAALGVAAIVSGVTIAVALASRRGTEQPFTLFQFVQPEIEEAGFLPIRQRHPQTRLGSQKLRQRSQMELTIHEELRSRQLRRQVELAPEITAA